MFINLNNLSNNVITLNKTTVKPMGVIIGGVGKGRAFHPWDNLRKCPKCGGFPYAVGKDGKDFKSGEPYKVICSNKKCRHESVSDSNWQIAKKNWNDCI